MRKLNSSLWSVIARLNQFEINFTTELVDPQRSRGAIL